MLVQDVLPAETQMEPADLGRQVRDAKVVEEQVRLFDVDRGIYTAVGSGGVHAAVRLSLGQHNKVAPLLDTVYNVYEAKKAAEVAPGVGKMTDLAIIKNGKVSYAGKSLFDALEKAHKEKPTLTAQEQEDLKKVCDDCTGTGN